LKTAYPCYIGIDVAKAHLDIAVHPSGEVWQVAHDTQGVNTLVAQLTELAPALVALEATGDLEMTLVGGRLCPVASGSGEPQAGAGLC